MKLPAPGNYLPTTGPIEKLQILPIAARTTNDGKIVLFHRPNSVQWYARLKINERWVTVSTGKEEIEEAKEVALFKYKTRIEPSPTPSSRLFRTLAIETIASIRAEALAGLGRPSHQNYIDAINKYLIPALGMIDVANIGHTELVQLDKYRIERLGRKPKRSTVATHNTALHLVFERAISKGLMKAVPKLHNKGAKNNARPFFSSKEFAQLTVYLDEFTSVGSKSSTFAIRELMRDYVLILSRTGMRTGREALGLKWNHISRIKLNDDRYGLSFSVNGKTGKRTLIVHDNDGLATKCLQRIQRRDPVLALLEATDLFKVDHYVFSYEGSRIKHGRLGSNFRDFLIHYGIQFNSQGEKRSLYSLRHMYATNQLLNGVDMATLAVQMGTSIAMLEKHYSKLKPFMRASVLHGTLGITPENSRVEKLVVEQALLIQELIQGRKVIQ